MINVIQLLIYVIYVQNKKIIKNIVKFVVINEK